MDFLRQFLLRRLRGRRWGGFLFGALKTMPEPAGDLFERKRLRALVGVAVQLDLCPGTQRGPAILACLLHAILLHEGRKLAWRHPPKVFVTYSEIDTAICPKVFPIDPPKGPFSVTSASGRALAGGCAAFHASINLATNAISASQSVHGSASCTCAKVNCGSSL